jgi:hypothetical protein
MWYQFQLDFPADGYGIKVPLPDLPMPQPNNPELIGKVFLTAHGKFKFISPEICLFTRRWRFFSLDISTAFPLKCAIQWDGPTARVEGRIPVGTTVFHGAFCAAAAAATLVQNVANWLVALEILLVASFFVATVVWGAIAYESYRAKRILEEIRIALSTAEQEASQS